MDLETTILYRPVGPKELKLIAASGYREFPPRLPEQPIFYPVLNEEYARQIARDWNVPASGAGYVVRFAVRKSFAERYPVKTVGASVHKELWIPAQELPELNRNISWLIGSYRGVQKVKCKMTLPTEPYLEQVKRWPASGKHILALFNESSIVVYQAYRPAIGRFAVENQRFGGEFSFSRMSWVKPNFLWMMYRSGWGTKPGQEVTLAVHLQRKGFEEILSLAVRSAYVPELYDSPEAWKTRLAESPVRLQWDPDHDPAGIEQERRAIQLGLAGDVLRRYAEEWIVRIEDISQFVSQQRLLANTDGFQRLLTPTENVYPVKDIHLARQLGMEPVATE